MQKERRWSVLRSARNSMAVDQSIPPHDKGLPVYSTYSTIFLMEFGCPLNQIFKGVISLVLWFWRQPVLTVCLYPGDIEKEPLHGESEISSSGSTISIFLFRCYSQGPWLWQQKRKIKIAPPELDIPDSPWRSSIEGDGQTATMRVSPRCSSKLRKAVSQPILRHSGCYKLETPSFDPRNNVAICTEVKTPLP